MRLVGWLLDVHVRGGEAVLWLKLGDGRRRYDGEAYVELVLDAAETLLGVLGVDRKGLTRGARQTTLGEVIGDRGG